MLGFEFDNEYGAFTRWVGRDAMKAYRPEIEECVSTVVAAKEGEPGVLGVPFLNNQLLAVALDHNVVYIAQREGA